MLDWQDELPLDIMNEIKAEASERDEARTREIRKHIMQKQWQENKVSISSGFSFQNSEFVEFELTVLNINQKFIPNQIKKNTSIYGGGGWKECSIKNSLILKDVNSKIVVGSCSLGSDGFIAYVSNNNELIWSIYSEHTGAFRHIDYKANEIIVESSRGYRYLIPLDNPLEVKDLEAKLSLDKREKSKIPFIFEKKVIRETIQRMWNEEEVYTVSGFLFNNGVFFPFEIGSLDINERFMPKKQMKISPFTIHWGFESIKEHLILEDKKGKIVVGSSSYKSDGFIAFISINDEFIWSISSRCTGTLIDVQYNDGKILVQSRDGYRYLIPIDEPLRIKRLENKIIRDSIC